MEGRGTGDHERQVLAHSPSLNARPRTELRERLRSAAMEAAVLPGLRQDAIRTRSSCGPNRRIARCGGASGVEGVYWNTRSPFSIMHLSGPRSSARGSRPLRLRLLTTARRTSPRSRRPTRCPPTQAGSARRGGPTDGPAGGRRGARSCEPPGEALRALNAEPEQPETDPPERHRRALAPPSHGALRPAERPRSAGHDARPSGSGGSGTGIQCVSR